MENDTPQLPVTNSPQATPPDAIAAAELIRGKLSRIYADEPDAQQELNEVEQVPRRSKHQQFMHELCTSGRDLATIQTAWHSYYSNLPPDDKHQVWQEFYANQALATRQPQLVQPNTATLAEHKQQAVSTSKRAKQAASKPKKLRDIRSSHDVQEAIRDKVTAGGKLETKHHIQSLIFGLSMGLLVVLVFLFSFFNEVILAPFIQPSRAAAGTPLIVSDSSVAATAQPEVIIPKINVEIPTDFSQTSTAESGIENALEKGVVHYPTTALPGQNGNAAFFGHSSNNIFNKGKYKFAFVLLHTIVPGDTFYLTYNSKVYVYKVISRKVVDPSEISVLDPVPGQTATATLITCDPPGTSLKRLVVVGQQISPDASGNSASQTVSTVTGTSTSLPGNGPTLLGKFTRSGLGKVFIFILIAAALFVTARWVSKPPKR